MPFLEPRYLPDLTRTVQVQIPRTWSERIFSRPWRPVQKYKQVVAPSMCCVFDVGTFTYRGHPEALKRVKKRGESYARN